MKNVPVWLLVFATLFVNCRGASGSPEQFSDASFTFSADPAAVVLSVQYAGGLSGTVERLTLYGDGRLELSRGRGPHIQSREELKLEFEEMNALLKTAVSHGLAEWDGTRIRVRQMELNRGKEFNAPTDHPTATILLSLEDYRRGQYVASDVDRTIRCYAPYLVDEHYPKILEIRGIVELLDRMNDSFARVDKKP